MTRTRSRALRQILNRHGALAAERQGRADAFHRPVHVFLQIASACNLDCYMCSEHNRPPEMRHGVGLQSLSRALYDKLADAVYPYSTMVTFGVGGEPTLSPDFPAFLERAWMDRQEVHLITNGTRLYRGEIAETVAHCAAFVQVSIDAATKETYERIRRGARWARLKANLDELARIRARQSRGSRMHLTLAMVLMRSNLHELVPFIEMAHALDADLVRAQHCIPVTVEGRDESLTWEPDRFDREREAALTRAAELGVKLAMPDAFAKSNGSAMGGSNDLARAGSQGASVAVLAHAAGDGAPRVATLSGSGASGAAIPCKMPTLDLFVMYDGRVFPCCHPYAHRRMQVGDLRSQSFAEVWNGPLYRSLRAGLRSGDAPLACRTCSLVHDPPPALEDPDAVERAPDLAGYYHGREVVADARDSAVAHATPGLVDLARRVEWSRLARDIARGRIFRQPEP